MKEQECGRAAILKAGIRYVGYRRMERRSKP
jgi:hypothetical protein